MGTHSGIPAAPEPVTCYRYARQALSSDSLQPQLPAALLAQFLFSMTKTKKSKTEVKTKTVEITKPAQPKTKIQEYQETKRAQNLAAAKKQAKPSTPAKPPVEAAPFPWPLFLSTVRQQPL